MRGISRLGRPVLRVFADTQDCCQMEWESFLLPRYTSQVAGDLRVVSSIKEANVLLVSGQITKERQSILAELHSSMHKPQFVVAMGICQMGGWFGETELFKLTDTLPVSQFIPGCAPSPDSLVNAFNSCILSLKPNLEREYVHAHVDH